MPHVRHGGNGVFAFASDGSKFEGTGFEREHIGHIQVAGLADCEAGNGGKGDVGVPMRGRGDEVPLLDGTPSRVDDLLGGLKCRVIFGDDFRKPAWNIPKLANLWHTG
jgi:hypothetical protein